MYGIWDVETDDWVRELPSKVDDGGVAFLVFQNYKDAEARATKHYGYTDYDAMVENGHGFIKEMRE